MGNNHTKWNVLDREYIIKRPWLTARRDKIELPDGRIIEEYYVLEYLMREDEIRYLLENDKIYQALMVAPLYRYFARFE